MGLFCKGLHCAGCGRGIPLGLVLVLILAYGISNKNVDSALLDVALALASSFVVGSIVIALLVRWLARHRYLTVVYVRTPVLTYSEMKFLETGDRKWLRLVGGSRSMIEGEVLEDESVDGGTEIDIITDR
jgi:hypothetical protein